jgi:myo-inositol-1(or 4)-monophosphatase
MSSRFRQSSAAESDRLLERVETVVAEVSALAARLPIDVATGGNPSSDLDAELHDALSERLRAIVDVGVISEEDPIGRPETDRVWVIDPLDGTLNAIVGSPAISVSAALLETESLEPLLGVVSAPLLGRTYSAVAGRGMRIDQSPAARPLNPARRDLVAIGIPTEAAAHAATFGGRLRDLIAAGWTCRQSGSAALDLAWTAAGYWRAFWEAGASLWDVAAADLIAQEAGLKTRTRPTKLQGIDRPYAVDYLAAEHECFERLDRLLMPTD